jgi:hypothetical protein
MEEEYEAAGDEVLLDNDDDGGWLATHGIDRGMEWCLLPKVCCNGETGKVLSMTLVNRGLQLLVL